MNKGYTARIHASVRMHCTVTLSAARRINLSQAIAYGQALTDETIATDAHPHVSAGLRTTT